MRKEVTATVPTAPEDLEKLRAARESLEALSKLSKEARMVPAPGDNVSAQWWTDTRLRIEALEKLATDQAIAIARVEERLDTAAKFVRELIGELRGRGHLGPAKKKGPTNGKASR